MRVYQFSVSVLLAMAISGCRVGPDYVRPNVDVPGNYRGLAPSLDNSATASENLGNEKWAEVFKDPTLQQLIREALGNNLDIWIAAQRVLEQQDALGITRSQQFPTLGAGGSYSAVGIPSSLAKSLGSLASTDNGGKGSLPNQYYGGGVTLSAAWNLDFWGLYRHQTEAARAQLLATEWGRRIVVSTVVENVATAYFELRTLDAELEIAKKTLAARQESLQLTETLERSGSATLADVRQAQELVHTTAAAIPDIERQIEQVENGLSILIARNPGPIVRSAALTQWSEPKEIPAGIPSELLERRPDIKQAEAALIAANANIGVARARLFPQLSLSAEGGTYSSQLKALVDSKNMFWTAGGNVTQTIFDAGRLRNNVKLSEAQQQEQVFTYQRTVQNAFRDVSDALIAIRKYRENREEQRLATEAAEDAVRLARIRYSAGSTNYLEVLVNDTNYYSSQMNLAVSREQEVISMVRLYSALGGGWQ